jgi:hypothetical protein
MNIKRTLLNTVVGFGLAAGLSAAASAEEITIATVNNADMIVMQKLVPEVGRGHRQHDQLGRAGRERAASADHAGHRHQRRVVRHHLHRRLRDADLGRQRLADAARRLRRRPRLRSGRHLPARSQRPVGGRHLYAVPLYSETSFTFYRTDLFEAGIDAPTEQITYDRVRGDGRRSCTIRTTASSAPASAARPAGARTWPSSARS